MAISTFYSFEFVESVNPESDGYGSDAASLDGGGVAVSSHDSGLTIFEPDGDVAGSSTAITDGQSSIAQLDNGNIVIAATDGDDVFYTIVNGTGSTVVASTGIGEFADEWGDDLANPDVASLAGGGFVIAYQDYNSNAGLNEINIDIRNNDGSFYDSFTVEWAVGDDNAPSVAALSDGGFAVAWHRGEWLEEKDLWYAVYNGDGSVRKYSALLDSSGYTNKDASVVALDNGGFAIAYENSDLSGGADTDIALARFDADGVFIDTHDISQNSAYDYDPSTTVLSNGMILVGSTSDGDAAWTLVDQNTGARLGSETIGSSSLDYEADTSVAAMNLGQFGAFFTNTDTDVVSGQVLQAARFSTGDRANDTIVGDDLFDIFYGGEGADTLRGGLNADYLSGDDGNDTFQFANGEVGLGEVVNGGADVDRIVALSDDISFIDANLTSIEEIEFSTLNTTMAFVRFRADQIGAGLAANLLVDGNATDVSDILQIEMGTDTSVSLAALTFQDFYTSVPANSRLAPVGDTGAPENDHLVVIGDDDAETIVGSSVRDEIFSSGGDDALTGGPGGDYLFGQSGSDTASYAGAGTGVIASLANSAINTGDAAGDTYISIENLTGSGFDDFLNADDSANIVKGGQGADTIKGYGGSDTLNGNSENDTLIGGAGADFLNGGADSDTASYLGATAGVVASLANSAINTGDAAGDIYTSVENLTGSGFDDSLNANASANIINGGEGADTIKPYQGIDTIAGGLGNDNFVFDTALDDITNVDAITDFNVVADTIQLENAIFTALTATGTLAASAFKDIVDGPKDADDRIIYNSGTGNLYYDADGSGAAFGNVKFASLANLAELTAADFLVI